MTMALAARTPTVQREELSNLYDHDLLRIVRTLPRYNDLRASACETLTGRYQRLVRSCVRRYLDSPEPTEDLMQVGYVGPAQGDQQLRSRGRHGPVRLRPAVHHGEIKRHFRDKRWQVHVRRAAQERCWSCARRPRSSPSDSAGPPATPSSPRTWVSPRPTCGRPARADMVLDTDLARRAAV